MPYKQISFEVLIFIHFIEKICRNGRGNNLFILYNFIAPKQEYKRILKKLVIAKKITIKPDK